MSKCAWISIADADVLLESWIDLFETGDGATIAYSLEHSRHFFSMIVKSIAVQGIETNNNPEDTRLVKLTQLFTSEIIQRYQSDYGLSQSANDNLVAFLSALLSIVPQRHVVFATINAYLASFGPGDSYKVKNLKSRKTQCMHMLFQYSTLYAFIFIAARFKIRHVTTPCGTSIVYRAEFGHW